MRRAFRLAALGALALWLASKLRRENQSAGGRVTIGYADGSATSLEVGSPERELLLATAGGGLVTDRDGLGDLLVEHALLEGDFLLRSGSRSSYYLDKYRFETQPGAAAAARRAARRACPRDRAGGRSARRAGPRSGRAGRFGIHGVRSAVHHRAR